MAHGEDEVDGAIEMPRPTVWPMTLSLSLALAATGAALGSMVFALVGATMFAVSLWRWYAQLLSGDAHEYLPRAAVRPAPIVPRLGKVEKLKPGMIGHRLRLPEHIYPISAGLKGGLAGGLIMPIPALAWGLLSGHGLWFPVNLLAGLVLPGVEDRPVPQLEQFHPGLFVMAIIIHAVMSAVVGLVYGVLLPIMPARPSWQLVFGGFIIPVAWTGFSGGLMGLANPALREYVNWYWFGMSQVVFGLTAALVVVRSEKVAVPPAGPAQPEGLAS